MCLNVKIILDITKVVTSNSKAKVDFLTNTYENKCFCKLLLYNII